MQVALDTSLGLGVQQVKVREGLQKARVHTRCVFKQQVKVRVKAVCLGLWAWTMKGAKLAAGGSAVGMQSQGQCRIEADSPLSTSGT